MAAIIRKLKRAAQFSIKDWSVLLRSWIMLFVVEFWLKTKSYKSLKGFLTKKQEANLQAKNQSMPTDNETRHLVELVDIAGRSHIVQMSCLRRALVKQWLLSTRGVEVDLRFGVKKIDGELLAHAWLEKDGCLISEPEIIREQYTQLMELTKQKQ